MLCMGLRWKTVRRFLAFLWLKFAGAWFEGLIVNMFDIVHSFLSNKSVDGEGANGRAENSKKSVDGRCAWPVRNWCAGRGEAFAERMQQLRRRAGAAVLSWQSALLWSAFTALSAHSGARRAGVQRACAERVVLSCVLFICFTPAM